MGLAFGHCVCVCVCVRAIFSTLPPRSPSVLPQVCHSLASICRRPLAPTPVYPLPLSWSPFCQDEKILILMALRLFSFFFFFATQQWCDGLSCMPHGCSLLIGALSRHIYTRTCTRFCTHTHTLSGDRGLGSVWFFQLSPPLPPPWLPPLHPSSCGKRSRGTPVFSPHRPLLSSRHPAFPKTGVSQFMGLACWRVFGGGDFIGGGLEWR